MVKKFFSLKETEEKPFVKVDFATFMCLMTILVLGLFISLAA